MTFDNLVLALVLLQTLTTLILWRLLLRLERAQDRHTQAVHHQMAAFAAVKARVEEEHRV
jgi:hypothetical protein